MNAVNFQIKLTEIFGELSVPREVSPLTACHLKGEPKIFSPANTARACALFDPNPFVEELIFA